MFNTKKELNTIRSEAGQFRKATCDQINNVRAELHRRVSRLERDVNFDFVVNPIWRKVAALSGEPLPKRTLKTVIKEITDRLDQQEKMQRMLFEHLGLEYAKLTEETASGRQEKEVLRKIKKHTK